MTITDKFNRCIKSFKRYEKEWWKNYDLIHKYGVHPDFTKQDKFNAIAVRWYNGLVTAENQIEDAEFGFANVERWEIDLLKSKK
jgi:hypothetical protein